jgi:hypothetical protein
MMVWPGTRREPFVVHVELDFPARSTALDADQATIQPCGLSPAWGFRMNLMYFCDTKTLARRDVS